jgi:hypothetical protein
VADDPRRRHDPVAGDVVGQIEQAADQRAVARDDLRLLRVAPALREPLRDETALRADRHDHRVLDVLRLHQPEDLGAEILEAVRPADPAARDPPHAQVHARRSPTAASAAAVPAPAGSRS